jgi:hypothetical protein
VQEPLARALVRAGADIVVGAHAHVQLGAGYLGSAACSITELAVLCDAGDKGSAATDAAVHGALDRFADPL